ncbi:MAG TPA: hypothetical protein VHQ86_06010, partial [Candidatus Saccharimonadia bacterium]|nr:hypothetical protein [Candidatus Saccharimonadia bacterium]
IEMSRPGTPQPLQERLSRLIDSAQHIKADGSSGDATSSHVKVIAPEDTGIEPGEHYKADKPASPKANA